MSDAQKDKDLNELDETKKVASKKKATSKKEDKLLDSIEIRLNIYENLVHPALPGASKIVVENLGGGDVYASSTSVKFDAENLIAPDGIKEFKGNSVVLCSASRPLVRISQFK